MGSNRGFSLLEVLISAFIMTLALAALLSVLTTGLKAETQSVQQTQALDVAERVLARILNDPRNIPVSFWRGRFRYPDSPWKEGIEKVDGTDYSYQLFLNNVTDNETGDPFGTEIDSSNTLRRVDVLVTWQHDGPGRLGLTRLVNRTLKP